MNDQKESKAVAPTGAAQMVQLKGSKLFVPKGQYNQLSARAAMIKLVNPGAQTLTDAEALALSVFEHKTGLNAALKQCWYVPKVGAMAGIQGLRLMALREYEQKKPGERF